MSKNITIGLFAILFIASGVQSFAISRIQKDSRRGASIVSKNLDNQASLNQQAAVGLYGGTVTDPNPPTPQGFVLYITGGIYVRCAYVRNGTLYTGGRIDWNANGSQSDINSSVGCNGATAVYPTETVIDTLPSGRSSISGDPTQVMQLKLFFAGYLDVKQLTGKLDKTTSNAIMSFQKAEGLPATGVFETKTQLTLDNIVFLTDLILKRTGGNDPAPEPEGYFVYQDSAGVTKCGYYIGQFLFVGGTPSGPGDGSASTSAGCKGATAL